MNGLMAQIRAATSQINRKATAPNSGIPKRTNGFSAAYELLAVKTAAAATDRDASAGMQDDFQTDLSLAASLSHESGPFFRTSCEYDACSG